MSLVLYRNSVLYFCNNHTKQRRVSVALFLWSCIDTVNKDGHVHKRLSLWASVCWLPRGDNTTLQPPRQTRQRSQLLIAIYHLWPIHALYTKKESSQKHRVNDAWQLCVANPDRRHVAHVAAWAHALKARAPAVLIQQCVNMHYHLHNRIAYMAYSATHAQATTVRRRKTIQFSTYINTAIFLEEDKSRPIYSCDLLSIISCEKK